MPPNVIPLAAERYSTLFALFADKMHIYMHVKANVNIHSIGYAKKLKIILIKHIEQYIGDFHN